MTVSLIAMAVALAILWRAVDEIMQREADAGASDDAIIAMLARLGRVMGGTALFVFALVALYVGAR